jgi:hypothetical protein
MVWAWFSLNCLLALRSDQIQLLVSTLTQVTR